MYTIIISAVNISNYVQNSLSSPDFPVTTSLNGPVPLTFTATTATEYSVSTTNPDNCVVSSSNIYNDYIIRAIPSIINYITSDWSITIYVF